MMLRPLKPSNRRARILPGLVFSFPCGDGQAIGIVGDKGKVFYAAFLDRLLQLDGDLEELLRSAKVFAGFRTTDALLYHGEWPIHGCVDPDEVLTTARLGAGATDAGRGDFLSLATVVSDLRGHPDFERVSFSPAVVAELTKLHFGSTSRLPSDSDRTILAQHKLR